MSHPKNYQPPSISVEDEYGVERPLLDKRFRFTGEFKPPHGEDYLDPQGNICYKGYTSRPRLIVEEYMGETQSDTKDTFEGGAVREIRTGKGRYDLISPIALRRLAVVCEEGANKYSDRNWESGMPVSRLIDSALRHINQHREGWRDEDHLGHALWNIAAAIHMEEVKPEFDDLPSYQTRTYSLDFDSCTRNDVDINELDPDV